MTCTEVRPVTTRAALSPRRIIAVRMVAVLTCWVGVLAVQPQPAAAAGSHAYVSLGAGATDLSGGVAWMMPHVPVTVGAEVGLGNLFWSSFTAAYHPLAGQADRRAQPLLGVSITGVGSSPYNATGMSLVGGVIWWPWPRVGVRTEVLKFWPVFDEDRAVGAGNFRPRLWAARAGIAFRW